MKWLNQFTCGLPIFGHFWVANYTTGKVTCKLCGKVSKKNYYHKTGGEKY